MSKSRFAFALAIEELEEEQAAAAAVSEEVVPAPAVDEETATVTDEVETEATDAEAEVEVVDQAAADAEALDQIAAIVEAAQASTTDEAGTVTEGEGLSPAAAEVVEVAVEAIYRRYNLKPIPMPAMEAFGAKGDRRESTRMAAEAINEQAKKIWASIVKWFENVLASVKAFFAKAFDGNLRLKTAAEKLAAKAKATNGAKSSETLPKGSFVNALEMGGKFDVATVQAGLAKLSDFNVSVLDDVKEFGVAASALTSEQVAELAKNPMPAQGKEFPLSLLSSLKEYNREGGSIYLRSEELPGNRALVAVVPADWKQSAKITVKEFTLSKVWFGAFDEKAEGFKGETVPTASAEEVGKIADAVVDLTKWLEARKAISADLQKDLAGMIAGVKKGVAQSDADPSGVKVVQKFVQRAGVMVSQLPSAILSNSVRSARAALEYGGKSLAVYGAAKPAEAK